MHRPPDLATASYNRMASRATRVLVLFFHPINLHDDLHKIEHGVAEFTSRRGRANEVNAASRFDGLRALFLQREVPHTSLSRHRTRRCKPATNEQAEQA